LAADSRFVERAHATAIAVGGRACLIRGPSGSGKSDLALRCIAVGVTPLLPTPALLISDDQVELARDGLSLIASAPAAIAGKLEVRGQGIVTVPTIASAPVVLIVDLLSASEPIERLPDPPPLALLCGLERPVLRLHPFEASAPVKVLLALMTRFGEGSTPAGTL
jgi:HPr kinase/phosphorylase